MFGIEELDGDDELGVVVVGFDLADCGPVRVLVDVLDDDVLGRVGFD